MPMYSLIEYIKNYRKTIGSLWNYYRDEPKSGTEEGVDYFIKNSKSFDYKTTVTRKVEDNSRTKDVQIAVPLKPLSNFWRTLDMPLIKYEVSLTLMWPENSVLTTKATRNAAPGVDPINNPTSATLKKNTKLYGPVVTLSAENDNKLLQQLKIGFKRTINWNKYRSEMSNQNKNNNLNYLIDSTFTKVNRLFVLSFENFKVLCTNC